MSDYFDPYAFYDEAPLSDENFLSSQLWDLYAPTSDTQAWNRINAAYPYLKGFSTDALLQTDPLIRGVAAQAVSEAGTGPYAPYRAYDLLQSDDYQGQLQEMLGRTEWDQIAGRGDIGTIIAQATGDSEAIDAASLDYTNRLLENFYEQAAPTAARNLNILDSGQERFGGRPYPGGDVPGFSGPAFSGAEATGGSDPLQALAMSPQYADSQVAGVVDPGMLPQAEGDSARAAYSRGSMEMFQGEPILDFGEAADKTSRIVNDGPEGYSRIAVIGGRKYALPDTLPGPSGISKSYMDELRRRADDAGFDLDYMGELRRREDEEESDGGGGGGGPGFINSVLDRTPGLGDIRRWIRDRLPRGLVQ